MIRTRPIMKYHKGIVRWRIANESYWFIEIFMIPQMNIYNTLRYLQRDGEQPTKFIALLKYLWQLAHAIFHIAMNNVVSLQFHSSNDQIPRSLPSTKPYLCNFKFQNILIIIVKPSLQVYHYYGPKKDNTSASGYLQMMFY